MLVYANTQEYADDNGTRVRTVRRFWIDGYREVFVVRTVADPRVGYVVTVDDEPAGYDYPVIQGWFGPGERWKDQHDLLHDLVDWEANPGRFRAIKLQAYDLGYNVHGWVLISHEHPRFREFNSRGFAARLAEPIKNLFVQLKTDELRFADFDQVD